jgi:hypothetical protein
MRAVRCWTFPWIRDTCTGVNAAERIGTYRPEIVESYRDYQHPVEIRQIVEDLLESVPSKYLAGLTTIVLTNRSALTRDQRRQKIWARNSKYPLAEARGAYYEATRSRPASVWLLVDNILKQEPPWALRAPLLRYNALSSVLYHEIGHHIHAVHRPIYEGKENVAEDWSRKLSRLFYRRRYWYLIPVAYPALLIFKLAKRIKKMSGRT